MSIFKRIGTILLALTLCFCSSISAFAAEPNATTETIVEESVENDDSGVSLASDYIGGNTYHGSDSSTMTVTVYLSKAMWNTTFEFAVSGNSNGLYDVVMTTPSGSTTRKTIYGNGSADIFTLVYSAAGTYTFTFSRATSGTSTVTCYVNVYS